MSPDTFVYAVPFIDQYVVLTLRRPPASEVNAYFGEIRTAVRDAKTISDVQDAQGRARCAFFDRLLQKAEVTTADENVRELYPVENVVDAWKENCISKAFEVLGSIKN